MHVQPYLFFDGRAEEAIEFYRKTLGAEVEALIRFRDHPQSGSGGAVPPGAEDKVMHMSLRIGDSVIMGSDGECGGEADFKGFSLTLAVESESEADRLFSCLADGGEVRMPLAETFFSPRFGMLTDRFGVGWMVIVGTGR